MFVNGLDPTCTLPQALGPVLSREQWEGLNFNLMRHKQARLATKASLYFVLACSNPASDLFLRKKALTLNPVWVLQKHDLFLPVLSWCGKKAGYLLTTIPGGPYFPVSISKLCLSVRHLRGFLLKFPDAVCVDPFLLLIITLQFKLG